MLFSQGDKKVGDVFRRNILRNLELPTNCFGNAHGIFPLLQEFDDASTD